MSLFSSLKAVFSGSSHQGEQALAVALVEIRLPNSDECLQNAVTDIQLQQQQLSLKLRLVNPQRDHLEDIQQQLLARLESHGVKTVHLHVMQVKDVPLTASIPSSSPLPPVEAASTVVEGQAAKTPPQQSQLAAHPRIHHVIVVASGKGGVGKSTTTVNLALALQQQGLKVGVLDADIYGPSIPSMLGTEGKTPLIENEQFIPIESYGMPTLSIGHLIGGQNTPVAWRGPKATGALMQLFNQTQWPDLDILLIDMPPGTGDIQLTLAQRIPVSGAVIVTTPQHIALLDAEKAMELFNKVSIPILGVVENMATHICSNCGFEEHIFGDGGGEYLSEQYHVPLLGQLPLSADIRLNADAGRPSVLANDAASEHYTHIAQQVVQQLAKIPQRPRDEKRIF